MSILGDDDPLTLRSKVSGKGWPFDSAMPKVYADGSFRHAFMVSDSARLMLAER